MKSKDIGIKSISLENFRVFKDKCDFELAPITILTGANSSGKSTIIKAQKILKDFWNKEDESYVLDFTKGNHQLGNYDLVVNHNNKKKTVTVTYELGPFYILGSLTVEIVFSPDKSNDLKNGKLESFSIYRKNKTNQIQLFSISSPNTVLNREYFIQTLFKEINETNKLIEEYNSRANKYRKIAVECRDEINGYRGNIIHSDMPYGSTKDGDTLWLFHPEATEVFCKHINVDKTKFDELSKYFNLFDKNSSIDFYNDREVYSNDIDIELRNLGVTDIKNYKYLPELAELVTQIPKEKYDELESALWYLLSEKYPEIENNYTLQTFIEKGNSFVNEVLEEHAAKTGSFIVSKNDLLNTYYTSVDYVLRPEIASLNDLKSYLIENVKVDFESFVNQNYNESLVYGNMWNDISKTIKNLFEFNPQNNLLDSSFRSMLFYLHNLFISLFPYKYNFADWVNEEKNKVRDDIDKKIGIKKYEDLFPKLGDIFIRIINTCIKDAYYKTSFLEAVRANVKRDYHEGDKFYDFALKYKAEAKAKIFSHQNIEFRKKWVKEFLIGDDFDIYYDLGTVVLQIKKEGRKYDINSADLGYGVTQFLPMLMQIIYVIEMKETFYNGTMDFDKLNPVIYIEEPESNLHPNLQSKLAELFVDAYKTFGVKFVIETHSEYLIRKLQYLTAKGDINPNDTVIHYIGNPDTDKREPNEKQVRTMRIKSNGQLTQPFGSGFFDEADKLAMLLLDVFYN